MLHRRDMAGSPRVRATFVALAVAALVAVGAWTLSAAASSPPTLPAVQPQELVASVLRAMRTEPGVSGHVETHADFGITALASGPLAGQADQAAPGGLGALASLLGDHHVRVWSSSDGLRISDQLPDGERSIFLDRSNGQAWAWDWKSFTAVRLASVGPATAGASPSPMDLMDPQMAAGRALDALTPSTSVSMGAPERVAGRVAYVLVLRPRTTETLVGQVEVAIDAARRIPLSVAVTARGASVPALSATFTSVRFGPIDPSVYAFSPPKGAHVEQGGDAPMFGDAAEGEGAAGIEGRIRRSHRGVRPNVRARVDHGGRPSYARVRRERRRRRRGPLGQSAVRAPRGAGRPYLARVRGGAAAHAGGGGGPAALSAIVTRGLSKRYGDVAAVESLDLRIERGTLYGFLGPNGAGKTTTIRMLLGLILPSGGDVEILGRPMFGGGDGRGAALRRVGAIVEEPAFWGYLSGRKNLECFARAAGPAADRRASLQCQPSDRSARMSCPHLAKPLQGWAPASSVKSW